MILSDSQRELRPKRRLRAAFAFGIPRAPVEEKSLSSNGIPMTCKIPFSTTRLVSFSSSIFRGSHLAIFTKLPNTSMETLSTALFLFPPRDSEIDPFGLE